MGVYIKGMEMPTSEKQCKLYQPAPFRSPYCVINGVCSGLEDCPLVPVPPHGDLIDRDALMKGKGRYIISFGKEGIGVAEINRAPAIIPAEEGET